MLGSGKEGCWPVYAPAPSGLDAAEYRGGFGCEPLEPVGRSSYADKKRYKMNHSPKRVGRTLEGGNWPPCGCRCRVGRRFSCDCGSWVKRRVNIVSPDQTTRRTRAEKSFFKALSSHAPLADLGAAHGSAAFDRKLESPCISPPTLANEDMDALRFDAGEEPQT